MLWKVTGKEPIFKVTFGVQGSCHGFLKYIEYIIIASCLLLNPSCNPVWIQLLLLVTLKFLGLGSKLNHVLPCLSIM